MFKSGVILLFLLVIVKHDGSARRIQTRNLANFGTMIFKATNGNPLKFNNYGNYCGKGGSGVPVDAIDQCCQNHDHCYTQTKADGNGCSKTFGIIDIEIYAVGYYFTVKDGNITCEGGDFISVLAGKGDCADSLCECDKTCTDCFVANLASYNKTYEKGLL